MPGRYASIASIPLAAMLLLALAAPASAACGPFDIAGRWRVVVGTDTCRIRVPASGLFPRSRCFDAAGRRAGQVTGRLRVDRACNVRGSAVLKVGRRGSRLLVEGRMSATRDFISGVLRSGDASVPFAAYAR